MDRGSRNGQMGRTLSASTVMGCAMEAVNYTIAMAAAIRVSSKMGQNKVKEFSFRLIY
jgi:hypothetical protein